jgi:geranyl-CoA carboxylase alpha subunit
MDGAIVAVLAQPGEQVVAGQTLVVLEAMKMEHQLKSGINGRVESISVSVGDQVKERQQLLSVVAIDEEQQGE